MSAIIYALCAATGLACTVLLARSYAQTRLRLTGWSAACFALLTLSNVVLVLDRVFVPDAHLVTVRLLLALAGLLLLLFGLIWESD